VHDAATQEANLDWLLEQLQPHIAAGAYLVFDFPGQVELFTHHDAVLNVSAQ
jgi:hypothetical protein